MKRFLFLFIALNFVINLNAQTLAKNLSNTTFFISKEITHLKYTEGNIFKVENGTRVELTVETFEAVGNLVMIEIVANNESCYRQVLTDVTVAYFDTDEMSSYSVFNSNFSYLKLVYDKENKSWYADIENELKWEL